MNVLQRMSHDGLFVALLLLGLKVSSPFIMCLLELVTMSSAVTQWGPIPLSSNQELLVTQMLES